MANDAPSALSMAAGTSPVCAPPACAETVWAPVFIAEPLSAAASEGTSGNAGASHASTPCQARDRLRRAPANFFAASGDVTYIFQLPITRRFLVTYALYHSEKARKRIPLFGRKPYRLLGAGEPLRGLKEGVFRNIQRIETGRYDLLEAHDAAVAVRMPR